MNEKNEGVVVGTVEVDKTSAARSAIEILANPPRLVTKSVEKKNKIALIDLDGTCANFDKSMEIELAKIAGPNDPPYSKFSREPYIKFRRNLIRNCAGFWLNLEPLYLGFDVINELKTLGFYMHVLTQGPRNNPNAWSEKFSWVNKHLPDTELTVTQNKSLTRAHVLVDDWSPYFLEWLKTNPEGLVICIAHPWNEVFAKGKEGYQDNIFRYDGSNREELKLKLQEAFDR